MPELNASIRNISRPPRMASLPISDRGFPVPWFVAWLDDNGKRVEPGTGTPDFRIVDTPKVGEAYRRRLCWLCGRVLGQYMCFVVGPMCAINRASSEPPSHLDCAEYAARACPFLVQPRMQRNRIEKPDHVPAPGIMIQHNPGVTLIWTTRSYRLMPVGGGEVLFNFGEPERVAWWSRGRAATREECLAAINMGLPHLQRAARLDGGEKELAFNIDRAMKYLPAETVSA